MLFNFVIPLFMLITIAMCFDFCHVSIYSLFVLSSNKFNV